MSTPEAVLRFWFDGDHWNFQARWFGPDQDFDAAIRERFAALQALARDGALHAWAATPGGALALAIVLDQFPRNLHRGDAAAYACDPAALALARDAVLRLGFDRALTPTERVFLYLSFEHAEALADQDVSVALFEGLRDHAPHRAPGGTIDYAWRHRAVIARFGRFPHRNAALGRADTPAEASWLAAGGGF